MQIGIHTGAVKVGLVGDEKFQYDVWGEPVNVAINLHFNARPGRVLVSPSVYEQAAQHLYDFAPYPAAASDSDASIVGWSLKGMASAGPNQPYAAVHKDEV